MPRLWRGRRGRGRRGPGRRPDGRLLIPLKEDRPQFEFGLPLRNGIQPPQACDLEAGRLVFGVVLDDLRFHRCVRDQPPRLPPCKRRPAVSMLWSSVPSWRVPVNHEGRICHYRTRKGRTDSSRDSCGSRAGTKAKSIALWVYRVPSSGRPGSIRGGEPLQNRDQARPYRAQPYPQTHLKIRRVRDSCRQPC